MSARTDIVGIGRTGSSNWDGGGMLRGRVTPDIAIRLIAQSRCDWSANIFLDMICGEFLVVLQSPNFLT
jgi:hypothetical protein